MITNTNKQQFYRPSMDKSTFIDPKHHIITLHKNLIKKDQEAHQSPKQNRITEEIPRKSNHRITEEIPRKSNHRNNTKRIESTKQYQGNSNAKSI